ncbi:MAG TPA: hypothetical protein VH394_14175 [Thermoanaerobaculia bacterium]|jgi:hypothetical protein|nr:hypothetical protein [Thermoanaerobaculia bacterium]
MNHRHVEEMNIPDLYATGRLSSEDEEAFENHLLECRECREQVAWADDFGSSMRFVAVEEAAQVSIQAGFLIWLSRRPVLRMALTAALLVVAALPAWLLTERSSLQAELAKARAAAARPAPPAPPVPQASPVPQSPDPEMQAKLESLSRDNSRLTAANEALGSQLDQLMAPQANVPIFSLGTVRGATDLPEIEVRSDPELIVLSLDPPPAPADTYRASVFDAQGHRVWQVSGLKPSSLYETLDIRVSSSLLKPGEYRISLEGVSDGQSEPAGELSFRTVLKD